MKDPEVTLLETIAQLRTREVLTGGEIGLVSTQALEELEAAPSG